MQFKDEDGALKGLILNDCEGRLVWAGLGNDKAYRKSLENSTLWVLDGKTGRLLPLEDMRPDLKAMARIKTISLVDDHIVAESAAAGIAGGAKQAVAPVAGAPEITPHIPADGVDCTVLGVLEALIRKRKAEMPEGSYTTHLFKSGLHKIRKKTGEEAVELVLAKDQAEVVSESADLLYHMLVLLVEWGVPLESVMEELKRRY